MPYIPNDYTANCAIAKPHLPKGCRFIELGEVLPHGVTFIYEHGRLEKNDAWAGLKMTTGGVPCFIKAPVKKPAFDPEKLKTVRKNACSYAPCIANLDKAIRAKSAECLSCTSCFYWSSSEQGELYWHNRVHCHIPLSSDDIAYLKALKAEFKRREKAEAPKSAPAPKPVGRIAELEKEVKTLRSELDALKANVAKASVSLKSVAADLVAE